MSSSSAIARAAIASMMTMAMANDACAAAASCQQAARHLASLVRNNWPSDENAPGAGRDMIGLITRKPAAGIIAGTTRFKLTYSRQEFTTRAERLKPPFTPSGELLKALDDLNEVVVVVALPGTNMLAANSLGGTAHCNSTVFFSTANRGSRLLEGPASWKDDHGASCGVTRSFVSIDRVPFAIDDSLDFGPSLVSTLTLTPWIGGKWAEPCEADFVFAPHFDTKSMLNDWPSLNNWEANHCGNDCEGFQRAALELVRQTQLDPAGAEARLLAAMTVPQRDEYLRLKRITDRPDAAANLPAGGDDAKRRAAAAALTDTTPLLLPIVIDSRAYLATVGHFTIGWRYFSDWQVTVETGEADKTKEIARFAIAMTPGRIVSATVK